MTCTLTKIKKFGFLYKSIEKLILANIIPKISAKSSGGTKNFQEWYPKPSLGEALKIVKFVNSYTPES